MALNHPGTVAAAALPPAPLLPMALDKGLDKQKVKQLKEVFPNCSDKALISALERADGNPDTAIDLLLLDSAEEEEAGGAGERPANENNDDGEWLADFTYPNVIMLDDDGWETFPTTVENKGEPWDVKTEAMVVNVERGRRDPQPISLDDDDGNTSSDEFIDLSGPDKGKAPALVHVDRRDKTTIVVDDSSSDDGLAIINALFNPGSSASPSSSSANHELQLVTLDAGSSSTAFSATPVTLPPAPESESEPVTLDLVLASVQAVFPDCDPEFVATLYAKHKERVAENQLVEMCVADVAETEGKYPKLETGKNKRKREEEPAGEGQASGDGEKSKRDYSKCEAREGLDEVYYAECKQRLLLDFPSTPDNFIKQALNTHHRLYVPTYDHLVKVHAGAGALPYNPLKTARHDPYAPPDLEGGKRRKGKGKGKAVMASDARPMQTFTSLEMEREWTWLQRRKIKEQQDKDAEMAERMNEEEYEATGNLIECGCCYSDYPFDKCTSCDDGHLFCMECARRNAEEQIGMRRTELKCFDTSGCKFSFPLSEVRRFLPPKLFEGFMKVVQAEELRRAELPDLVSCPFCDYAAIVEDPNDKEFRCGNPDCMEVSCRSCQNKTHIPMSCQEYAKENVLSVQHKIEEAMTEALLRECPKCKKKFYKTEGCNKMTCSCGQAMCYCCRKPIKDYNHFRQLPGGQPNPNAQDSGCPLFDNTVKRNADDVVAAAKAATEAERAVNPDIDLGDVEEKVKKGIVVQPTPDAGPARPAVVAGVAAVLGQGAAPRMMQMQMMQRQLHVQANMQANLQRQQMQILQQQALQRAAVLRAQGEAERQAARATRDQVLDMARRLSERQVGDLDGGPGQAAKRQRR